VTEETSIAPRKFAFNENVLNRNNSQIQIRNINYDKRNLYNTMRKTIPKIPKSFMDVHNFLSKIHCMTSRNENFLQYDSNQNGIIIFCCKINFEICVKQKLFT